MNKIYLLYIGIFAGLCILSGACTQQQGADPIVQEMRPFDDELSLFAQKTEIGLFEVDSIWLTTINKKDTLTGLAYYLGIRLDSVRWEIPDILNEVYSGTKMPIVHVQTFYLPGKYVATVTGYKDGEAISHDTTALEVHANGDFLGIDWLGDDELTLRNYSYTSLQQNFTLSIVYRITDDPYMLLSYKVDNFDGRDKYVEQMNRSRRFLSDYITQLYGKSDNLYSGENVLKTTLDSVFTHQFNNSLYSEMTDSVRYYPLEIWHTPNSRIALIGSAPRDSGEIAITFYKLLAEQDSLSF